MYLQNKHWLARFALIKKIILYSFLIFVYHLFLLVLPFNIFLIGLKIPFIIEVFPWLFYPFLIFSPVLTILLSIRTTPSGNQQFGWIFPVTVSWIGYFPIFFCYFSISALNNIRNYSLVAFFPIIIGLVAFWGSRIIGSSQPKKPTIRKIS